MGQAQTLPTGQGDSQSKSGTGRGTGQGFDILPQDGILTACPVPSLNIPNKPQDKEEKRVKKLNFFKSYDFF